MTDATPFPLPDWCGAGLYTPVVAEDGRIVAESRRMCGLKEPHEWHQDRYDATVRWRAPLPFAERLLTPSRTAKQPRDSVAGAKGGLGAVAPGTTKHPDLVTHHDPSAEDAE